MNPILFKVIILIGAWKLLKILRVDFQRGLRIAALFFVMVPNHAVFFLPQPLPNITIPRIILLELLWVWLHMQRPPGSWMRVPLFRPFAWLTAFGAVSVLFSWDVVFTLKTYLAFSIEILLFYIIVLTSTRKEDVLGLVRAMATGLTIVAVFAVIERYYIWNPSDYFPGYTRKASEIDMILSTYPHRILLGAAMAMGFPLVLVLMEMPGSTRKSRWFWGISSALMVAADYYSDSRGPWLGLGAGIAALLVMSSGATRKRLAWLTVLAAILLMLRPGVWESLTKRVEMTTDSESHKGQTYLYRWELWRKAFREISCSPGRFLVGFGPGATEVMDLTDIVSYTGESWNFWSWDNHYAAELFEKGTLGFAVVIFLDLAALGRLFMMWRRARGADRELLAGIFAAVVVLLFMKTNVKIFAPQLNYLGWTLIAAGYRLTGPPMEEVEAAPAPVAAAPAQQEAVLS
jgi:hypothetical protein